tara:strand:- start:184 stop:1050 length:867 start_codon:yes stop_codon:yes gene_type:complete
MANTWNQSGTTWNTGRWGTTDAIVTGWGAKSWNDGDWGELSNETVFLTGQSATLSVGSLIVFPEQGWGRDTWNFESWGESSLTVELTAPDAISSSLSVGSGWNNGSYGQEQGWGQFVLNPADVVGLTGQAITSSVGAPTIIGSVEFSLTGVSSTVSVGALTTEDVVGLTGQAITSAVGTLSPADVVGLTGVSSTSGVGSININSSPIISVTGLSATVSVGTLSPADVMGLTGQAITSAVGTLSPADVMGLTGQSITVSVAGFGTSSGFGIQAYQDVDTGSNTSYTDVA